MSHFSRAELDIPLWFNPASNLSSIEVSIGGPQLNCRLELFNAFMESYGTATMRPTVYPLFARIDSPLTRLGEEQLAAIQVDATDGIYTLTVDVQYIFKPMFVRDEKLYLMVRPIKCKLYINDLPLASFRGGSISIHRLAADQTPFVQDRLATFFVQHPLSSLPITH